MTRITWRALLLVLFASVCLCACASEPKSSAEQIREGMSATRDAVREVVSDPARREKLLVQVDELEGLLSRANAELVEGSKRLQALNADANAGRAELDRVARELVASRRALRVRALDVHFQMIAATTPEEWAEIVEREMDALGAAMSLQEG